MIGFTEPLAIIAYVLRAFRIRRIFDAQLCYFEQERKPVAMIENFKETRLIKLLVFSVCAVSICFMALALSLMFVPDEESMLYLLPTIDTAAFTEGTSLVNAQSNFDDGMTISFYFLILYSFLEGLMLLLALQQVRNFNEDFNLFDEIRRYAAVWLIFTNLILWEQI